MEASYGLLTFKKLSVGYMKFKINKGIILAVLLFCILAAAYFQYLFSLV